MGEDKKKVKCPSCKGDIAVTSEDRPLTLKCKCGKKAILKEDGSVVKKPLHKMRVLAKKKEEEKEEEPEEEEEKEEAEEEEGGEEEEEEFEEEEDE